MQLRHPSPRLPLAPACIDSLARAALALEFELADKPGLVSPYSNGSHTDMHAGHFRASIAALSGYFAKCARLAAAGAPFARLQAAGLAAETAMLKATGGVNTHKGAIFTLGLLSAALGARPELATDAERAGEYVACTWGAEIRAASLHAPISHGRNVGITLGLPGAREQAAAGFPLLFALTLPTLQAARRRGLNQHHAALEALIATIATLPDTNLAHRGGLDGLRWAQREASAFMRLGGMSATGARQRLRGLAAAFAARRLSPGGAADLLAAALFMEDCASHTRRRGNLAEVTRT